MNDSKSDKIVIISSVLVSILCFLGLTSDFSFRSELINSQMVGKIVSLSNDAKRRVEKKFTWQTLQQGNLVFNGDYVKTGENSNAIINFGPGLNLFLGENSLVHLDFKQSRKNVSMKKGLLYAVKKSEQNNFSISVAKKSIKILQGEINLVGDGKTGIKVGRLKGKIKLKTKGKKDINLTENSILSKDNVTIGKKVELTLASPSYRQRIALKEVKNLVRLSWENLNKKKMPYMVIISKDYLFEKVFFSKKTYRKDMIVKLGPGAYYWKVKSLLNELESVTGFFFLEKQLKLDIIQPSNKRVIKYTEKLPGLQFLWNNLPQIYKYQIFLASDKLFTKNVITYETQNRSLFLEGEDFNKEKKSKIFWKVEAVPNAFNPEVIKSEISEIRFIKKNNVDPVIPVSPRLGQELPDWMVNGKSFTFVWQAPSIEISKGVIYILQVSKDKAFKKIIITEKTKNLYKQLSLNTGRGKVYWRIISNIKQKIKPISKIMMFSVVRKELEVISPLNNVHYDYTQVKSSGIRLHWKNAGVVGKYTVFYGKQPNFRNSIKIGPMNRRSIQLKVKSSGVYFWKVVFRSFDNAIIRETMIKTFKVNKSLESVSKYYPDRKQVINFTTIDQLSFRWRKVVGASHYIFKLFQTTKFGKKIPPTLSIVKKIKNTFYNVKMLNKFDIADFFYTLKPIKVGKDGSIIRTGPEIQVPFSVVLNQEKSDLKIEVIE